MTTAIPWRPLLAFLYALRVVRATDIPSAPDGITTEDPPTSADLLLLQFEHSLKNGVALDDSSPGAAMEVSASGEVTPFDDARRDADHRKELRLAALREQLVGRVNESGPVYDAIAKCFRSAELAQTEEAVSVPAMLRREAVEEKTVTEEDLQNAVIMILAIQQKLGGNATRPLTDFIDCVSSSSGFMKCLTAIGNVLGMGTVTDAINKIRESGCTSFDGCMAVVKNGVMSVVNTVWDWIKSQANALFETIKNGVSSAVGQVMDWINVVVVEATNIWNKIKSSVNTVITSIASFFNSLPAFEKFDLGEVCTPENVGFWGMVPTDCGAFSDLGQMFTDICHIDSHAKDFGNKIATCFQKTGLFGIPTPFFDLQINRFCLPQFIVTPLEYLIGAVIWGQSFVTALIDAAKSIFTTIKDFVATKLGLFQLGTAVAERHSGESSDRRDLSLLDRSDVDLSKASCGPQNAWHITLSFTAKLAIGIFKDIFGVTPSFGFIFLAGCKDNTPQYPSFLLKFGFTAAVDIPSVLKRKSFTPKADKSVSDFLSGLALKFTVSFGWQNFWPSMYRGRVSMSSDIGIEGGLALKLGAGAGKVAASLPVSFNLATNDKATGDYTSNFLSKTNWVPQAPTGFELGWTATFSAFEDATPAPGSVAPPAPSPIAPSFEVNAGITFKFCLINCGSFEVPATPQAAPACKPVSTSTADNGYVDNFRGWYDVQGCGLCNDYCRWVGNSGSGGNPATAVVHGQSFWSCRLAGTSNAYTVSGYFASFPYQKCSAQGGTVPVVRPVTGVRYVKFVMTSADCMQISFLAVMDSNGNNVALNKAATTNGGYGDSSGNPMIPVTGSAGNRNHPGEFHGNCANGNWWMVDLGGSYAVNSVVYYNRADCCQQRGSNTAVQLLDASQNLLGLQQLNGDAVQTLSIAPVMTVLPQVRYVKLVMTTADCMQISFLAVMDFKGNNLALNKAATTNGGYGDSSGNPMNAVSGSAGNRNHPGEFHGNCANGNWWMVDLGGSYSVSSVIYYNRADCCQQRGSNTALQLLDASQTVLGTQQLNGDAVQTLSMGPVRYVRLVMTSADCMQISFLAVMDSNGNNVALNKVATTNGGYGDSSGNPMNAVTGSAGNRNHPGEFHGNCANGNWWMVDLGGSYAVRSVAYYNRADCCQQRGSNTALQLLDASQNVLRTQQLNGNAVQMLNF